MSVLRASWLDESGTTSAEMAILVAFMAVIGICAWNYLGGMVGERVGQSTQAMFGGGSGTPATQP